MRNEDGVRIERTGWRDQEISERHRLWGFNCPAVDLDFVMAEYNHAKPVALVEYKHFNALGKFDLNHPTLRALSDLATGYRNTGIPFFIAVYWPGIWAFKIIPCNKNAHDIFTEEYRNFTEQDYVRVLYWLREITLTNYEQKVIGRLCEELPPEEMEVFTKCLLA